jgi:hypothetical protein
VQLLQKPTTKLPYKNLQYPTYVKDTNPDAHIRVFKKAIKSNGEIWKLISSTCVVLLSEIISLNGEKTMFKTIQTTLLKSWSKHFASDLEL